MHESSSPQASEAASASSLPLNKEPENARPAKWTLMSVLDALVRDRRSLIEAIGELYPPVAWRLLVISCLNLLLYGLVTGTFSMGTQLWAAPLKILAGTLFAMILCTPSLYIFANFAGLNLSFRSAVSFLLVSFSVLSLVLSAMTPMVWLFSQSTDLLVFIGPMHLLFWMVSVHFGYRVMNEKAEMAGIQNSAPLQLWKLIFILVLFQMSTTLRPIIGSDEAFLSGEKRFFLQHWFESLAKE